jgi:DNA-binding transcriptional MerR regulator
VTAALRTGQVAAAAGVSRETLRYYERRGLLAEPERTLGGHRAYAPETVTRIRLIKAAQQLGFTLEEIADLTDPRPHRRAQDGGLAASARAKLAQVEARIDELEDIASLLREALAVGCDDLDTCATTPECPLPLAQPTSTGPHEQDR